MFCAFILPLIFSSNAGATGGGGFVPGVEGVMAATMPPPGFHYRMQTLLYDADTLRDKDGNEVPVSFSLKVLANVHRLIWMTGKKFLGADYGVHVIVPLVGVDLELGACQHTESDVGLGDITLEPLLLAWHGERWDAVLGLALNVPTGHFDATAGANCGTGTLSGLLNIGGTYYFDAEKSWSASLLTRTLLYGETKDTDLTPGTELFIEWGVGKQIMAQKGFLVRPGICGYSYWQLSEDDGGGASSDLGQVHALGAEANLFWLNGGYQANLRVLQEFAAEDEAEGFRAILTLTKSF
ncbi:hypothetical protein AAU61_07590 [Desulfocarbo indianensis]|nr:hypothetical protein AAU61_07590 [Desulfocarbo indianensis]